MFFGGSLVFPTVSTFYLVILLWISVIFIMGNIPAVMEPI